MNHHSHALRAKTFAKRQKGYTLIELSIALAIISVIIVGSLVGVQRILSNNRANNLLSEIPRINAALVGSAANANSNTLSTITTSNAASLGAFSPNAVSWEGETATVTNAFGGNIFIQGLSNTINFDGVTRGYVVTATGVARDMCATVVNGLAPLAQALWVDQNTTVPSGPLTSKPADADLIKGPGQDASINLGTMSTQCRGSTNGSSTSTMVVHAFIAI
ncbi:prepilin-type N-terminal cleavage/methylation domain-containing protein [Roseateles sp. YR242]|uniref:prepilin-type N-terminal cleavage/methylation domain-containing protein n=1 Tax=Roseateles sp. YR242 TaxID=1855305 RepID=UPI0008CCB898|nr:prepilin-type N-terminal cleavage/methylation domain-containing protein [Roseateles sp. YR242]SEL08493.1 prepilin-type N-terminal cleavage/methylation domain-containing protein [Roseateles sp. YR242]